MEVATVSPSPTSPTEGDDLCEIDVTNVAIHSVTLLICLCGLVGNEAVLRLLSLKRCNTHIFRLALADFLFLLFTVFSALLLLVEDMSCSLIMPLLYLRFLFTLALLSCYWALFWLMLRSNTVCMDKLCKLCCRCDLPERRLCLLIGFKFWAFWALFSVLPAVTNLFPLHQQEHRRAALISISTLFLLLFAAPAVISSIIKFIKAKRVSKKLKPKRRDIVVFLTVLFILFLILCDLLKLFGYTIVSSEVLLLLNCIHSSIKPFIYFLAEGFPWPCCSLGSLRLSLLRLFDEQKDEAAHSSDAPMDTGV